MIEYYEQLSEEEQDDIKHVIQTLYRHEQLSEEEQDDIKHVIQTLYRQTFLLERKFEKRTGRMVPVREYRVCSKHREFLEESSGTKI